MIVDTPGAGTRVFAREDGRWRDITPVDIVGGIYTLTFVDRLHGWIASNDCAAGRAAIYRTSDGGRTWRSTPIHAVGCNSYQFISVTFLDTRHGWLVTSPAQSANVRSTLDGGATWTGPAGKLPVYGGMEIIFRTPQEGWLGRVTFVGQQGLFATRDGGRTWHRRRVVLPHGWKRARAFAGVPTFFGRTGVLPVTLFTPRRSAVAFYVTRDGGETWTPRSVQQVGFRTLLRHGCCPRYVTTAVASPNVWWAVTGITRPHLAVTSDAGRHWRIARPPALRGARYAEISAAGPGSAWLTWHTFSASVVLATADRGRTWDRLSPPS